jgi:N-methylhydantoinase B
MAIDAIQQEIIHARLIGVVQEMQDALFRTGYSTIIRESQDASCALADTSGQVVAQHTVLPLHLGSFPACVKGLIDTYALDDVHEGDAFIVNDPYSGGSPHAPDMAVITPVFYQGKLIAFAGSIAHKSDIGGMVPGSCSGNAKEIFHEGLQLPVIRYAVDFKVSREIETIIRANSRTPDLVAGDIAGQVGCARLGERRLRDLVEKYGLGVITDTFANTVDLTEKRLRQAVSAWKEGVYEGACFLDSDGVNYEKQVCVRTQITVKGDRILFDFSSSDDQAAGPYNIRPPVVRAACYYAMKCLVDPNLPSNAGLARVVETKFREGSILDPVYPGAVNAYMPTAQAVTEAILLALGPVVPEKRIAGSGGTGGMAIGGRDKDGKTWVMYEIHGTATGARFGIDGVSATSVHIGNGRITPLEILESEFPVKMKRFDLIADSGGAGEFRGGLGFVRVYEILSEARLSTRSTRHVVAAVGTEGGADGALGRVLINPGTPDEKSLPARVGDIPLKPGDILRIERAGGGGMGDPKKRPHDKVRRDVAEGYITAKAAKEFYGVDVDQAEAAE